MMGRLEAQHLLDGPAFSISLVISPCSEQDREEDRQFTNEPVP
jgi:hypothetical protein